jgi:hypothetical protein
VFQRTPTELLESPGVFGWISSFILARIRVVILKDLRRIGSWDGGGHRVDTPG